MNPSVVRLGTRVWSASISIGVLLIWDSLMSVAGLAAREYGNDATKIMVLCQAIGVLGVVALVVLILPSFAWVLLMALLVCAGLDIAIAFDQYQYELDLSQAILFTMVVITAALIFLQYFARDAKYSQKQIESTSADV